MSIVVYDPVLASDNSFNGVSVEKDFDTFKANCDIILANRYDPCLDDVANKVYTRDIYHDN